MAFERETDARMCLCARLCIRHQRVRRDLSESNMSWMACVEANDVMSF